MHGIKGYAAKKINKILNRKGSVWLDENFDRIIRNDDEFTEKMNYVMNNPLKAGFVENVELYKWLYVIN